MVNSLSNRWRSSTSEDIAPAGPELVAEPTRTRHAVWGRGACRLDLSEPEQERLAGCKARLSLWSDMYRRKDAKYDGLWEGMPLFFFGPSEAPAASSSASSADSSGHGHLMMVIFAEFQPKRQLFIVNRSPLPAPGTVVRFTELTEGSVLDENGVARQGRPA